jgi:UDP-N-acetylmuramate--alanine ligase
VFGRTKRMHFVGIGGVGMSGIAELLVNLGYEVSGSDLEASMVTDRLKNLGAEVFIGHDAGQICSADVVIVSSAIRMDNPEVVEANQRKIPVIPRAEILAELMRLRYSIAVAGAHGKTSTTSMVSFVLEQGKLDPTAIIGGHFSAFGSNVRFGRGDFVVAEADESDRSFLLLSPTVAVITNIDREHLESYGSFKDLRNAFLRFSNKVPFYGVVVVCVDDPNLRSLVPQMTRRVVTYSLETSDADVYGSSVELKDFDARCKVRVGGGMVSKEIIGVLDLHVPGRHNLLNGLAAVAVGLELGLSIEQVTDALGKFRGVERRFHLCGEVDGVLVVDDYAHHPTEIEAVLSTARESFCRRVVVGFQPHRYSRTRDLLGEFGTALAGADEIVLTNIYSAGEERLPGVGVKELAEVVRSSTKAKVQVVEEVEEMASALVGVTRPGDLVLTLGAGSIGQIGPQIIDVLKKRGLSGENSPEESDDVQ